MDFGRISGRSTGQTRTAFPCFEVLTDIQRIMDWRVARTFWVRIFCRKPIPDVLRIAPLLAALFSIRNQPFVKVDKHKNLGFIL